MYSNKLLYENVEHFLNNYFRPFIRMMRIESFDLYFCKEISDPINSQDNMEARSTNTAPN